MKIAVIGAGIFGCSIAWYLAKHNHVVHLYEKEPDILQAASGINQFRLHRGYHYPRSKETITSSLDGEKTFRREFSEAIMDDGSIEHYYCIAKEKTLTTTEQASKIWGEHSLKHEKVNLSMVNKDKIAASFKVEESLIDLERLKRICLNNLKKHKVKLVLNKEIKSPNELKDYGLVVLAMYANGNAILNEHIKHQKDYQFELCEKIVVKLPEKFRKKSIVIMDGPFTCIDPFGRSSYHLMGNVVHAIHHTNTGKQPSIPKEFIGLLNRGVIKNPPITNFKKFMASAAEFFPGIENAEHIGSMYTIRTVLPKREYDDARPTIVEKLDNSMVRVFSGKLGTCIDAAEQTLKIAEDMSKQQPF